MKEEQIRSWRSVAEPKSFTETTVVLDQLTEYGNDYFNENWYMATWRNGVPLHYAVVTDYDSVTGTFTCKYGFLEPIQAGDLVYVMRKEYAFEEFRKLNESIAYPKRGKILVGGKQSK